MSWVRMRGPHAGEAFGSGVWNLELRVPCQFLASGLRLALGPCGLAWVRAHRFEFGALGLWSRFWFRVRSRVQVSESRVLSLAVVSHVCQPMVTVSM